MGVEVDVRLATRPFAEVIVQTASGFLLDGLNRHVAPNAATFVVMHLPLLLVEKMLPCLKAVCWQSQSMLSDFHSRLLYLQFPPSDLLFCFSFNGFS